MLPQEWLATHIDAMPQLASVDSVSYLLLPHCTERTNAPGAVAQWSVVFKRLGLDLKVVATGCCGMAGLYGHEAAHRKTSEVIYGMSWSHHVANPSNVGRLLATGYSCRSQVGLIDDVAVAHPIQILLATVKARHLVASASKNRERAEFTSAHHEEY